METKRKDRTLISKWEPDQILVVARRLTEKGLTKILQKRQILSTGINRGTNLEGKGKKSKIRREEGPSCSSGNKWRVGLVRLWRFPNRESLEVDQKRERGEHRKRDCWKATKEGVNFTREKSRLTGAERRKKAKKEGA